MMNTKLIWRLLASIVTVLSLTARPLPGEEPIDDSEYLYCCQGNPDGGGHGRNYRWYNSQEIETVDGEIIRLDNPQSSIGNASGTHLMIKTARETIEVHLAPSWYLAEQDFDLSTTEKIEVIGSRINIDGITAIIARKIRKGNKVLVLRDQNGIPLWSGHNQW